MNRKYFPRKPTTVLSFILITAGFFSFSLPVYGQEKTEKQDKAPPRLTREAQMAMVEAQRFMEKEDFARARKPLLDYIATQPETIPDQVYLMLGYLWYVDENIEEALKVFKEAHAAYPENPDILKNYALTLYEDGHFAEAAPMMEKLYDTLEQKDIKYLDIAWSAYYQADKWNDAKRVLKRMIDMSEKPEASWFTTIISICLEQGQTEEAESLVFQALGHFPMDVKFWQWLANLRQEKDDFAGATGAYEIGSYVQPPKKKDDWRTLIDLYQYLNVPMRVANSMKMALKNDNAEADDHISIAVAYAQAMRIDEAISYLDKIIAQKFSARLLLEKGKILYNARRNEAVIKAMDELIAIDPDEGEAHMLKGLAAWDLKDWETMEEAFTAASGIKEYRTQAKNYLGIIESLEEAQAD